MAASDIIAVAGIYAEILDVTYISFSELKEGKATAPGRLTDRAPEIFRRQLDSHISSARHGFYVALVDDEAVGFVLASLHQADAGHTECWIDDLGVRPAWRRRGIATALVERACRWGAAEGAKYFLLESGVQNESAHRVCRRLGFEPLSVVLWRAGCRE
jgi:GNAT superfamily N-acetyltransferase